ncbi:MAG TPA: hypothetical protein VF452_13210 [Candidatus Binatia bacterium]
MNNDIAAQRIGAGAAAGLVGTAEKESSQALRRQPSHSLCTE